MLLSVSQDNDHFFYIPVASAPHTDRRSPLPALHRQTTGRFDHSLSTQSTSEPDVVKGTCDKIVSGSMSKAGSSDCGEEERCRNEMS